MPNRRLVVQLLEEQDDRNKKPERTGKAKTKQETYKPSECLSNHVTPVTTYHILHCSQRTEQPQQSLLHQGTVTG